ncbi:hypothetical protein Bca52824_018176 [Brassica carinata]|uniref:Uncharacterized protein n=1 Tax=Brassica carinata TaxID=52824 RepID=A0A8X8AW56_BRACI|nr:hypothetical protein Bca52824_018176 [Brassica carinata]
MQGHNNPDLYLPPRLFATDHYPCGRLNIYSKPELLAFIRHVLRDTDEFQFIKNSCFGGLFDLQARQCPVSRKLIHAFSASKSSAPLQVCLVERSLLVIPLIEKTSLKHTKIHIGSS